MTNESYEERLDKRLTYVDELKARIAELESEAAAFDTALWSGRLQEVEQYNANANARIAELEAQVAEMRELVVACEKLYLHLLEQARINEANIDLCVEWYDEIEIRGIKAKLLEDEGDTIVHRKSAPTLAAALVALSREVEGE